MDIVRAPYPESGAVLGLGWDLLLGKKTYESCLAPDFDEKADLGQKSFETIHHTIDQETLDLALIRIFQGALADQFISSRAISSLRSMRSFRTTMRVTMKFLLRSLAC
jgi:hypothetical protein